jgi:hypothetical protein
MCDSNIEAIIKEHRQEPVSDISLDGDLTVSSLLSFFEEEPNTSLNLPTNNIDISSQHLKGTLPSFEEFYSDVLVADNLPDEDIAQGQQFSSSSITRAPYDLASSELDDEFYTIDFPVTNESNDDLELTMGTFDQQKDKSTSPRKHHRSLNHSSGNISTFEKRVKFQLEILRRCTYRTSFSRLGVSKIQKHILKNMLTKSPSEMTECELKLLRLYVSLSEKPSS